LAARGKFSVGSESCVGLQVNFNIGGRAVSYWGGIHEFEVVMDCTNGLSQSFRILAEQRSAMLFSPVLKLEEVSVDFVFQALFLS